MALLSKKKEFEDAGFVLRDTVPVLLPYHVWYVDLLTEQDRRLRFVEETVLKLISAGLTERDSIATYMGLGSDEVFRLVLIDLLGQHLIKTIEDSLALTPKGERAVRDALTRIQRTYENVQIKYDPYDDTLSWFSGNLLPPTVNSQGNFHVLPEVAKLTPDELKERHLEVQELVNQGVPVDAQNDKQKDLILMEPLRHELFYKRVNLEIWSKAADLKWRLIQEDVELTTETKILLELEGERVLPRQRLSSVSSTNTTS
jgi:hypothetical protein